MKSISALFPQVRNFITSKIYFLKSDASELSNNMYSSQNVFTLQKLKNANDLLNLNDSKRINVIPISPSIISAMIKIKL